MKTFLAFLLLLVFLCQRYVPIEAACSSCLVSSLLKVGGRHQITTMHHSHHNVPMRKRLVGIPLQLRMGSTAIATAAVAARKGSRRTVVARNFHFPISLSYSIATTTKSTLIHFAITQLSTHFGCNVMQLSRSSPTLYYPKDIQLNRNRYHLLSSDSHKVNTDKPDVHEHDDQNTKGNTSEGDQSSSSSDKDISNNNISTSMISTINIYKQFISPLLPPACRFLPTCSQYGVQAIEQFGPQKGCILIAWRLLRCSPFGGRGYDPPKWPPVGYTYGSY